MRKVVEFDDEIFEALKVFALESGRSVDDLAHEACELLLKKHCRPKTLKEALQMSLRRFGKNDNRTSGSQKRAR